MKWLSVMVLTLLGPVVLGADSGSPKRVFVLYDENQDFSGLALLDRSLTSALKTGAAGQLDIYSEFMDVSRFHDANYEVKLRDFYRQKYAGKKIDLIMAVMGPSLDFLLKHGAELFPNTPIVFCGIDRRELGSPDLGPNMTGVLVKREFKPTLELALRLHPNTRQVVFIAGTSPFNRYWEEEARHELREFEARVTITYIADLPMEDIQKEVARLPQNSIILYLHLFRDGAGNSFNPHEALSLIAQKAKAPIYVFLDQYIGKGVVGGFVYSVEAHGAKAAEVGLRILNGEKAANIPVMELGTSVNMFDWGQLQRWGLSERLLPPGSVVLFRQPSFWDLYRWHALAAVALIAAQSALIAGLLIQRRWRRIAEREAQKQSAKLAHAARLATVGELTASIAHEINQPLGAILTNTEAAEMLLGSREPPLDEIRQILADVRKDDLRASEVIRRMRQLLSKRELEMQPLDINEVTAEVVRLVAADALHRNVSIDMELSPSVSLIRGDRIHLQQVLLNLIVNGMEAMTDTAESRRRLTVRTAWNRNGTIETAVTDAGHGIPPDVLSTIFDFFYTTKGDGMGLGLSIVRSIIEAHGGRIWAENNPGGGSTFSFSLPVSGERGDERTRNLKPDA